MTTTPRSEKGGKRRGAARKLTRESTSSPEETGEVQQTTPTSPGARWHPQLQASPLSGLPVSPDELQAHTLTGICKWRTLSLSSNLTVLTAPLEGALLQTVLFSRTPEVLTWSGLENLTILLTQFACPVFKHPPNPSGFSSLPGFSLCFLYSCCSDYGETYEYQQTRT